MNNSELKNVRTKREGCFDHLDPIIKPIVEIPYKLLDENINKALEGKGLLEIWKGGKTKMI